MKSPEIARYVIGMAKKTVLDLAEYILKKFPHPQMYPAMLNAAVTSFAIAFWDAYKEYIGELGEIYGLKPPEVEESG